MLLLGLIFGFILGALMMNFYVEYQREEIEELKEKLEKIGGKKNV